MLVAILALSALAALFGLLLGYANLRFKVDGDPVVEQIDALLPQTQCGQCGYPGCRPYAQAIAADEADINRCPPGGEATILALADLLGQEPKPLDPERQEKLKALAVIDENRCIGCTLCIQACPVDAILGAPKQLHTVITAECTGCELCVAPCPVDCIEMVPVAPEPGTWKWPFPETTHPPLPIAAHKQIEGIDKPRLPEAICFQEERSL
ncbi:electron transport complex subunit RsxB [Nitrosococcus oceani]|uniref:Ion-translocating oxidoreductase complex subunit B n=2 Tax=Nitrosococcus oceani TaxID=1229 RepID=Q3JBW9_NITOC|nr:electron transport complex subunit RsxB [Nitrosococcus oceani]KFI19965.1 electron transporter RnfB [Nitrosococcus oceani C-27]ABA57677.1 Electron transport complex, RnfABCDGE type, B subunit [Nitrosococcus oceani ATCC 19707]EDZ67799.1 electron transport complex, RnfABCDGE type, B subunit subfamily [Nitrosococcus oceani AFC27]KFI23121.1 electron transporter RnfB [Nitrosococcus oceani]GEM19325.1 electron transport complex subunit RsxB [Nitrosococcus oceani]